ncbi:MAG: tyrosine-protein phosphatase [Acholeplasmatales bacterium]|jgi:protein-tyrosine phosphatase|nr:tyrosine-protein phosphatase [Acholeplasmatales bacterium]
MRIPLKNVLNLRDMGGIAVSLNQKTKDRKFLRSGFVFEIDEDEVNYLVQYGLKVVIDLREEVDVAKHPDLLNRKEFEYHNVSLIEYTPNDGSPKLDLSLYDTYLTITDKKQDKVKEVFDIILNHPNDTILFHCFAGKDRTGVIAYLLLSIAGCEFKDILADYTATESFILDYVEKNVKSKSNYLSKMKYWYATKELLIEYDTYVKDNYSGPINYLLKIGLSKEDIEKIKNRFLTNI